MSKHRILALALLLIAVTPTRALYFNSNGWQKLAQTPNLKEDEQIVIHSDGFVTKTTAVLPKQGTTLDLPNRHSFMWVNFNVDYNFFSDYWIKAYGQIQKRSFSAPLKEEPFQLALFPVVMYQGNVSNLFSTNKSVKGKPLKVQAGTLANISFGQGLLYKNYVSTGLAVDYLSENWQLSSFFAGYGYNSSEDVWAAYLYGPDKIIGIGILYDINSPITDRLVYSASSEITIKYFRVYAEVDLSHAIIQKSTWLNLTDQKLFTQNNLGSLFGVELKMKKKEWFGLNSNFIAEARFYGKNLTQQYQQALNEGFTYQNDITSDMQFNDQPFNFYIYSGKSYGIYLRQMVEINPVGFFYIELRNELLFIRTEADKDNTISNTKTSGNDIFSFIFSLRPINAIEFGLKVSNVVIGKNQFPSAPYNTNGNRYTREPLFLEAANNLLIDLYVYYNF